METGTFVSHGTRTATMRVLVVDDTPTQRFLLASLVSHCNCTVFTASSGAEALEVAAQFKPDAVLLDLCMPEMDGYELATRLRNAGLNTAKLVAVSAWECDDEKLTAAHIDQYLRKPLMLNNVRQLLGQ
jgi:two-component system, OmpR family, response regulator